MTDSNGSHKLCRPAANFPVSGMAGFNSSPGSEPASSMAGFASGSAAAPVSTLAGFESANRKCRPTVSRSMSSSRAIRRRDQPFAAKVVMECCKLTLSMFTTSVCRTDGTQRNAFLKVAGFHSLSTGWF
jgi:hypothetical protein